MRSLLRLGFGALLGVALVVICWSLGWLEVPESLLRGVVVFSVLYPAPRDEVDLRRIDCPPLEPARLYLVCTRDCDEVDRVVLVRGLGATLLIDEGRVPPESESVARARINDVIRKQGLRLDLDSARQMIGCYLKLEGFFPALVLPPGGVESVEAARQEGRPAMEALVDRLDQPDAIARIEVNDTGDGFEGSMLYWDMAREGDPILTLRIRLAGDGEVRAVSAEPLPPS